MRRRLQREAFGFLIRGEESSRPTEIDFIMLKIPESRLSVSNSAVLASEDFLVPITLQSEAKTLPAARDAFRQLYLPIASFVLLFFLMGCVSQKSRQRAESDQMLEHNLKAAHDLALLFKLNSELRQVTMYADSLNTLSNELFAAGIQPQIPQCQCEDGKMRPFEYITGLGTIDGSNFVILSSPREMAPKLVVVAYLDGRTAVMDETEAAKELENTRDWVKSKDHGMNSNSPR